VILQGEEISIRLIQEGKDPTQGVGYLEDGTMVVVEGGRSLVGQTVDVVVTKILQTAAGKMIFARARGELAHRPDAVMPSRTRSERTPSDAGVPDLR
jgi:TRAM domain